MKAETGKEKYLSLQEMAYINSHEEFYAIIYLLRRRRAENYPKTIPDLAWVWLNK